MFGRKKNLLPPIDIRYKPKKTIFGGIKMVRTTPAEQRQMKKAILKADPKRKIIDSKWEKEHELDWIDRLEELDAMLDDRD